MARLLHVLKSPSVPRLSAPWRYAIPPIATLLVFLLQLWIFPHPGTAPFVFFFVAVALASWLGGRAPGLIAVALAAAMANYVVIVPRGGWALSGPALAATILFIVAAAIVALVCAAFRDAALRAERTAESIRRQADMLALSHDAILVWKPDGAIESWSSGAEELYGYGAGEALGTPPHTLLRTGVPYLPREAEEALRTHGRWEGELTHTSKDGRALTVSTKLRLAADAAGEHVLQTDRDITPRKQAEERVHQLNQSLERRNAELDAERMRWQGVVEGIAEEVWLCDAQGRMSLINLPDSTAMGLEEFEDRMIQAVLEEIDVFYTDGRPRPPEEAPLLRSLSSGKVVRGEEIVRHRKTGKTRYRQFSCAPTRDATGAVTGAVAIVRDVTQNKETEQALREAGQRKDEFLAMLSHELRNPLAPIRNCLYILDRAPPESDQARRARATIERQVNHLTRLVGDLLDVSRITRGKIELQRERLELSGVVAQTLEDLRPLFEARSIELLFDEPDRPVWVKADATRLAQAFGNVLQNAAKFTPVGGQVFVHLKQEGASAFLVVRDTGVGISPEIMSHLFEPFTQADRSLDRTSGGLGLGLALVKGLVVLHGGEVHAASEGPGRGAEITIRLPAEVEVPRPAHPHLEIVRPRTRRVLVIEDNVDAAESLKEALELDDHLVAVAYSGPEGLAKARAFSPDVVLCDIGLPGMDGYEVARAFRSDEALRDIALVALTGYAGTESQRRAVSAGFDRHMAKPPNMESIERLLAEMPERHVA